MALLRPMLAPWTRQSLSSTSPRLSGVLSKPFHIPKPYTYRFASQWRPRQRPRYNRFNKAQKLYSLWYTSPYFRYSVGATVGAGGIFYYVNLEQVPMSGRRRFNIISPEYEIAMAKGQDEQVLQQYQGKVFPPDHPYSRMVNRVLDRLIPAAGLSSEGWVVRVIDDPETKNAFVMPGGKVFVFSGILPICKGDDGLAAVLGHEISHNIAHHIGEKISSYVLLIPLAVGLQLIFDVSGAFTHFFIYTILTLPNSRKQETEADYLGLLMMAKACYDPQAAVELWQRMAKAEQEDPPQFLSTHPASLNRVTTIQNWLPQAVDIRNQSECGATIGFITPFREAFDSQVQSEKEDFG